MKDGKWLMTWNSKPYGVKCKQCAHEYCAYWTCPYCGVTEKNAPVARKIVIYEDDYDDYDDVAVTACLVDVAMVAGEKLLYERWIVGASRRKGPHNQHLRRREVKMFCPNCQEEFRLTFPQPCYRVGIAKSLGKI